MSEGADDNPLKPRDATVLRPRPGAGRRAPTSATMMRPAASTPPIELPPRATETAPTIVTGEAREMLATGLNPLVRAAAALLLLAHRLRRTISIPNVGGLRQHMLADIRRFEESARAAGVPGEVILAARYVLCTMLDEAVLATPWGSQSGWGQQTLLVTLHHEAWGGETFFELLQRVSADPQRHIDLMELQYLCLAFGFAGKYELLEKGQARLAEVQQQLYRKIRDHRGQAAQELSIQWRGLQDRRNPIVRYVPWWVIAAGGLALVTVVFVVCLAMLQQSSAPVYRGLAQIGLEAFPLHHENVAPTKPQPESSVAATLERLLAKDVGAGTVLVRPEPAGRTRLILVAPALFASASAMVNPDYQDTLQRVAAALDRVPGRVLIVGHTDDQPVRSLRYQDNFTLSRERAVSVAKLFRAVLHDPGRIESTGVGDSQPRYEPASAPENRPRNRRVEILIAPEATGSPPGDGARV